MPAKTPDELRSEILRLSEEYFRAAHTAHRPAGRIAGPDGAAAPPDRRGFIPGKTTVPYAGRVFDEAEGRAAIASMLDFWLTLGPEGAAFERDLAAFLGVRRTLLVNSGSSANLLAVSALASHNIPRERRLLPGDEVITCAAGFPTTVAPILQNAAVPVFIDNDPASGNAIAAQLEEAYAPGKTKAVILAHTLGNPFDLGAVLEFCKARQLWLIEDNCDALGSTYTMPAERAATLGFHENSPGIPATPGFITRRTGAWGDISTQSFYPPHHLTLGEGGAVNILSMPLLKTCVESLRDWGRDCWCPSGRDNTCARRFTQTLGELPPGYDHKYTYSHFGYNLKPLDPQAAIGRAQLAKLPGFISARKANWEFLRDALATLDEYFEFSLPTHATARAADASMVPDATGCSVGCSWFGFMLLTRPSAPFSRTEFAAHLDSAKIGNRMLFGGNLLRQPAFVSLRRERPGAIRAPLSAYPGADRLMNEAVFIGTYPGLTPEMLAYVADTIHAFVRSRRA
ncbi:MAG: lipopolysaccharide biosynthesis protein RfbH [Puniceicoccales bacterium]|jgi:CDP-6-deoxy-D-xylo-4-hexulose-3-dehydrase|nr:lipopolysaccharide biosynthesis protein RfbH [Puniceicoccales bacterium]